MAELSGVLCFSLQKFQTNSKERGWGMNRSHCPARAASWPKSGAACRRSPRISSLNKIVWGELESNEVNPLTCGAKFLQKRPFFLPETSPSRAGIWWDALKSSSPFHLYKVACGWSWWNVSRAVLAYFLARRLYLDEASCQRGWNRRRRFWSFANCAS